MFIARNCIEYFPFIQLFIDAVLFINQRWSDYKYINFNWTTGTGGKKTKQAIISCLEAQSKHRNCLNAAHLKAGPQETSVSLMSVITSPHQMRWLRFVAVYLEVPLLPGPGTWQSDAATHGQTDPAPDYRQDGNKHSLVLVSRRKTLSNSASFYTYIFLFVMASLQYLSLLSSFPCLLAHF